VIGYIWTIKQLINILGGFKSLYLFDF